MEKEGLATLFISARNRKKSFIIVLAYVGITAFIAVFGAVYEQYSHNVHTPYMWYAWVWVLGFGLIPHVLLWLLPIKYVPGILPGCFYNCGVAMITSRSIYIGVVTISNTPDTRWMLAYLIVSIILLSAGVGLYATGLILNKVNHPNNEAVL